MISDAIAVFCKGSPVAFVERVLGLSFGGARKKVNGERAYDAEEFARILADEGGFHVLAAVMDAHPNPPLWWRICRPLMTQADAELMALAAKQASTKAMRRVVENAARVEANNAQGRAALMAQDADYYGPALEAEMAFARVPSRAMAADRKTRR